MQVLLESVLRVGETQRCVYSRRYPRGFLNCNAHGRSVRAEVDVRKVAFSSLTPIISCPIMSNR